MFELRRSALVLLLATAAAMLPAGSAAAHQGPGGDHLAAVHSPGVASVDSVLDPDDGTLLGVRVSFAASADDDHTADIVAYRVLYAEGVAAQGSVGSPAVLDSPASEPMGSDGSGVTCDATPGGTGEFCTFIAVAALVAAHTAADADGLAGAVMAFQGQVGYDSDGGTDEDAQASGRVTFAVLGDVTGAAVLALVPIDAPEDAPSVIRDYALENAPVIVGVVGAVFLVGLTFYLIRRGLNRSRNAMRL